jgi:hypothetical protein
MSLAVVKSEHGSVAPLGIALLLGLTAMILALAAAGHAALTGNRLQALADGAILYAHDRVATLETSALDSQLRLEQYVRRYLEVAESLNGYQLYYRAETMTASSRIKVCAMWRNPLVLLPPREICRTAVAKSFEVTD